MDNETKYNEAVKVIDSCKSAEQLDTCESWVGQLSFTGDYVEQDGYSIDLKIRILEMRRYLERLANIHDLDTTGANHD